MKVQRYGDAALYVDLEVDPGPPGARKTRALATTLRRRLPRAEIVVGAGTLVVVGGALAELERLVRVALAEPYAEVDATRDHVLEAIYDGPDLEEVASLAAMSPDELVAVHSGATYEVELIGFLPGFAYLAGVDSRLAVPRRAVPRARVAPGSLGLAGGYTGVYPLASPGGWQLIGRVLDVTLFDPARDPPALLQPGDRVRFVRHEG